MNTTEIHKSAPAWTAWLPACLLVLLFAGCMEKVDAELPVSGDGPAETWKLAGRFGGTAEITRESADPWETRFATGGFREIAGVCATDSEVWVCDFAISRIQVFDFDGTFVRSIGSGVSINDTLLSDRELYLEDVNFPNVHDEGTVRWERKEGRRWATDTTELFRAADVLVMDDGYLIADRAFTSADNHALRQPRITMFYNDGTTYTPESRHARWPAYLAREGNIIAMSETPGNALWIGEITDEAWPLKVVTAAARFSDIMRVMVDHAGEENYLVQMRIVTAAGIDQNEYNGIGGVAVRFSKLVACDPGNHRLQVMEGRREKASNWGKVIRVVTSDTESGDLRFETPLDIDINDDGRVYLLDNTRMEVAVLSDNFDRIASFGKGDLIAPWALDLSDDGGHCFVTDQRTNEVLHYVRTE